MSQLNSTPSVRRLLAATSLIALASAAFPVAARAAENATAAEPAVDEIVVTGTLIRGIAPIGANVETVGLEQIERIGAISTNQLLANIPIITTQFNTTANTPTSIFFNVFRPNIRNIAAAGGNTTLVLVDGHNQVGVGELIQRVKQRSGGRLLVSTSYGGGVVPGEKVAAVADFLLLHGNTVEQPAEIAAMVARTRALTAYNRQPILFNEDDHFDFDKPMNNFAAALAAYAGWGYFDYRKADEPLVQGFQSMPADWRINSDRKRAFFGMVAEVTGAGVRLGSSDMIRRN